MIIKYKNIFDELDFNGYLCITTNSCLNNKGELIMGAGAALEAKLKYPNLPSSLGNVIVHLGDYGIRTIPNIAPNLDFIAFQTKRHWRDDSDITLISNSAIMLSALAQKQKDKIFRLNFPGIGNGGLSIESVKPIIKLMPDNVEVFLWKK